MYILDGVKYSISTDDEERFDYLVNKIRDARRVGNYDESSDYMNILDQQFGELKLPIRKE